VSGDKEQSHMRPYASNEKLIRVRGLPERRISSLGALELGADREKKIVFLLSSSSFFSAD